LVYFLCLIRFYSRSLILLNIISIMLSLLFFTLIKLGLTSTSFGFGMVAFILGHYFFLFGKKCNEYFLLSCFLIGIYLAGAHFDSASYMPVQFLMGKYMYVISNFLAAILVVYSILFSPRFSKIFSGKLCLFLGKVSFSVYLFHLLFIYSISLPIAHALSYFNYELSALFSVLLTLPVLYLFSYYYTKYIDRPSIRLSKKILCRI